MEADSVLVGTGSLALPGSPALVDSQTPLDPGKKAVEAPLAVLRPEIEDSIPAPLAVLLFL